MNSTCTSFRPRFAAALALALTGLLALSATPAPAAAASASASAPKAAAAKPAAALPPAPVKGHARAPHTEPQPLDNVHEPFTGEAFFLLTDASFGSGEMARVRLEVNLKAVKDSGLEVSSQMLAHSRVLE